MGINPYLCTRYPENNLFTLKELIPIEDIERLPVKVIALFFLYGCRPNEEPRRLPLKMIKFLEKRT